MYDWIYTDLDSILDTGLGTYAIMDAEYPAILLQQGYRKRVYDRFDDVVSWEQWRTAYAKRDKKTLAVSMLTNVLLAIKVAIIDKEQQGMTAPLLQPQLLINVSPYKLDSDEIGVLKKAISDALHVGDGLIIDFIDRPMEGMTPAWLHKENIHDMYYRNIEDWLQYHLDKGELTKQTCRDITVHYPALVSAPAEDPRAVLTKCLPLMIDIMSPFIKLDPMITEVFSIQ